MDWNALIRILAAIFGLDSKPQEDEDPHPTKPELTTPSPSIIKRDSGEDRPTVAINVFFEDGLIESNGRTPESVAARYIANSLSPFFDVDVRRMYQPVETPDGFHEWKGKDRILWWIDQEREQTAKDMNLLLKDVDSGGETFRGGKYGTAPAALVTEEYEYREFGATDQDRNLYGIVHEVWHALGNPGDEFWGEGWVAQGGPGDTQKYWHKTPCLHGHKMKNACGTYIPDRPELPVMRHFEPTNCAVQHAKVA